MPSVDGRQHRGSSLARLAGAVHPTRPPPPLLQGPTKLHVHPIFEISPLVRRQAAVGAVCGSAAPTALPSPACSLPLPPGATAAGAALLRVAGV